MPRVETPVESCTCIAIRMAARHVTQFYDSHLEPVGLTTTQYSILSRSQRLGAVAIQALATELAMDRTTLSRTIAPLERTGLLALEGQQGDKRVRLIRVTPAGLARLEEARARWKEAQRAFEQAFGANADATLRRTLADLVAMPLPGAA